MTPKTIDITGALGFSWETLRGNAVFFLQLIAVLIVVAIVPAAIIARISSASSGALALPLQFLNFAWQSVIGMGLLKICIKLHDRQPAALSDLWSELPKALDYILVKFLLTLITVLGLILFIVPGIIWMLQFFMAGYLVVDRGERAISALKASSRLTSGAKWPLAAYLCVILALNLFGALCLGIGLMITIPMTMLANVFVYRQLLSQTEAKAQ